jgi:putative colanic acid biosynthesis UDP-glucose lipid carrier transferase
MKTSLFNDPARRRLALRLCDLLALALAGQLALLLRFGRTDVDLAPAYAILQYFCVVFAFAILPRFGLYGAWHTTAPALLGMQLCGAWAATLLAVAAFYFALPQVGELSYRWLGYWYAAGLAGLLLVRLAARYGTSYARRHGWLAVRVAIVGYGATGQELHRRALRDTSLHYQVAAVCPMPGDDAPPAPVMQGGLLSDCSQLPACADACRLDEIWIALPVTELEQVSRLQHLLRHTMVEIRWLLDFQRLQLLRGNMETLLGFQQVILNCPDAGHWHRIGKYLFDKVFALAALAPLMLLIYLCVRLSSPGPAIFRQARIGLNGAPFKVYKFRTMVLHDDHGKVEQARANDPRVTRVGAFLRRTSLDELPQFVNVLRGEMSIVGPRPHAVGHTELYRDLLDNYMLRHRAKPGITGWAQINGYRGETDTLEKMDKRVQYDLYYIRHGSLWMDLWIVLWTALKGWTGKNTY